ncbi:MMPL family transporter, partial [Nocardioides sp.]|uniref:MMPL family transporter n=1 Tax=Nocardioides sp. TaxID=35761 RepID=UPI0027333BB2
SATVLVSLSGLRLTGLPTYDAFCFATGITVVAVAAASLTVVPALCRLAGARLLPRHVRRGVARTGTPLTARWAERVARRPLVWAFVGVTVMVTLALPTLDMRTWPQDASTQSTDLTTRAAYDLVAEEYGAGANGPLTIVVDLEQVDGTEVEELSGKLAAEPGIVAVSRTVNSPDGAIAVFELEPAFGASDARTRELVRDLRSSLPTGVELTGTTALFADIADMFDKRLWIVIAFVVAMSFLLLTLVFRSVLIPLKAAVMNLLSIGAAYGVLTAVFQWGWGAQLFGVDQAMPVSSWIPILIFAILFGLSMDYEVFLLSRIRERWLAGEDTRTSVTRGLADTGRVITAAAAIMVAVFLGFASEVDVVIKMLGVGMATAILLDATVVRMVLVPATMTLLGRWNWWLPRWIDRLLPTVHLEAVAVLERPVTTEPTETARKRSPVGV